MEEEDGVRLPNIKTTGESSAEEARQQNSRIKTKLSLLSDRFSGFEEHINLTRAKKKETEDKRVIALQKQLTTLQASLTLESQNRSMSMKALQAWVEDKVLRWTATVQAPIEEKLDQLGKRLDGLHGRLNELEASQLKDREDLPARIDNRAKELLVEIREFKKTFEQEQLLREEQNQRLLAKMQEQNAKIQQHFLAEKMAVEKKFQGIRSDLNIEASTREKSVKLISQRVDESTHSMQQVVEREIKEREAADDEIVQAINHYTSALQDGLKIVSAT